MKKCLLRRFLSQFDWKKIGYFYLIFILLSAFIGFFMKDILSCMIAGSCLITFFMLIVFIVIAIKGEYF